VNQEAADNTTAGAHRPKCGGQSGSGNHQDKDVKIIAKRQKELQELLEKGYATVYGQCSQQVRDKLKSAKNWEVTEKEQSLHVLISEVEKICVGFDHHKQEVFNLVQALRALFLYTQNEKDTVEEYGAEFKEPVGHSGGIWRVTRCP
jgi:hypothetical protein